MREKNILSVYFTAGYPNLSDAPKICAALEKAGVDLIELGIPFSDPVADGETIQRSSEEALTNGMSLEVLFSQLPEIRKNCSLPIILMGYFNPVLQYGLENFCKKCAEFSIYGTIIPDLPYDLYLADYRELFARHKLHNIFLITPQTSDERAREIDKNSTAFIYAVSSAAVTGGAIDISSRRDYLKRLKDLSLTHPVLVGFGVSTKDDFSEICNYADGAIIGSAFIRALKGGADSGARDIENTVQHFFSGFRNGQS